MLEPGHVGFLPAELDPFCLQQKALLQRVLAS